MRSGVRAVSFARMILLLMGALLAAASPAVAHNLSYALATLSFPAPGQVRIEIRAHIPALIMGGPQGTLGDQTLLQFMALSDEALAAREQVATANFLSELSLRADGRLVDDIAVAYPEAVDLRADAMTPKSSPRASAPIVLTAALPSGARSVDLALPTELGPSVLVARYADSRTTTEALPDGQRTRPIRLSGPNALRDAAQAFAEFVASGFRHILPGGLDHILFIVALAVAAPRLGVLVRIATVFTLAHSLTLGLGALRIVEVPAGFVEPAISLSIAAVGVLTILNPQAAVRRERLAIIFGFGLLHGLGFAGALREAGLPRGLEAAALAGFNVGIEFGQLAVIAGALAAFGWWRDKPFYRPRIAIPLSALVVVAGSIWTIQRIVDAVEPGRLAGF